MRIVLKFRDGVMIVPFHPCFDQISELKDTKSPFDGQKEGRTLFKTRFHTYNSKKTRCIVYQEQP